jgi:membrane-bound lytic murein transglycosylase A
LRSAFNEIVVASFFVLTAAGCQPKPPAPTAQQPINYAAPLPEGEVALRKIAPEQYPDFSAALMGANLDDLKRSVDNSLAYMSHPSSRKAYPYLDVTHERAVASLRAFRQLLDRGPFAATSQDLNRLITDQFEVYQSIGAPRPDGSGYTNEVLFTGYFTPTYDASLTRGGPYQYPLYKRPPDLITDESGDTASRKTDEGVLPYYTRQDIEAGGKLAGQELVWVTSRWNAYVITVQGSARLRLPDGRIMEVGYAGTNGYPYTSPGRQMVKDGLIPEGQLSFETMRRFFEQHPEALDKYLWMNQRTTFFTETHGGPYGSLNVPVTAFATIATDKKVYPPAMAAMVLAPTSYAGNSLSGRFVFDQDRGGAIRSAGRCDIYMGIGQSAEQMSGRQLSAGKLYYLFLKPELLQQYAPPGTRQAL